MERMADGRLDATLVGGRHVIIPADHMLLRVKVDERPVTIGSEPSWRAMSWIEYRSHAFIKECRSPKQAHDLWIGFMVDRCVVKTFDETKVKKVNGFKFLEKQDVDSQVESQVEPQVDADDEVVSWWTTSTAEDDSPTEPLTPTQPHDEEDNRTWSQRIKDGFCLTIDLTDVNQPGFPPLASTASASAGVQPGDSDEQPPSKQQKR